MYAPAFDFGRVKGATYYRFKVTAYGTRQRSFDAAAPNASLDPLWRELPAGRVLVERIPIDARGNVRRPRVGLPPSRWFEKSAADSSAPSFDVDAGKPAPRYRYIAWAAKELTFEADVPWAPLSPIWKDVPVGEVVLQVHGLDRQNGRAVGVAYIDEPNSAPSSFRRFRRKAAFGGPYHEAAADYRESAYRWLSWLARAEFEQWTSGRPPRKLSGYPSKFVGAAIAGMTALASLERSPARKREHLDAAVLAAKSLISASFPADWGLAHFPPTYSDEVNSVMMQYPASVGLRYLDLYEATGEKELLVAARKIADTYQRVQDADGSWPLLMDARTGAKLPRSRAELVPATPLAFFDRLIERHGFDVYRPMASAAWRRLMQETLATFRFEGQFEDTSRGGGSAWNLSHWPACQIAERLFRLRAENPAYVSMAEEVLRFAEDQFVIWEQPVEADVSLSQASGLPFTPAVLEQYRYMVPISASAANLMTTFQAAYEATGKEIYLAKAAAIGNAMTVIQAANGGNYVGTSWKPGRAGGWPNVHVYAATRLAKFGDLLQRTNLRLSVPMAK